MILVTGGAGFIGANFVIGWLGSTDEPLVNVDALAYAGNLDNLSAVEADPRHTFVRSDINDSDTIRRLLATYRPRAIVHFAAESHVDRSIHGPEAFIRTNIEGTYRLLECAREYWGTLSEEERAAFRFVHVSTDEVYGSLSPDDPAFTEQTAYTPNSPYSASKAASDHLARAWYQTYGLPTIITNCSNNYGPFQFPEKLIPLTITNALAGEALPIYGDGLNVRDWLYVEDHCRALLRVLESGRPGEVYNIGGWNEWSNIDIVKHVCDVLDEMRPDPRGDYSRLITYVRDRPGHDRRYAIDASKMERELDWRPVETFESGLRKTVSWYLEHAEWVARVRSGEYREWVERHYGESMVD